MMTKLQGAFLPYIMDSETRILRGPAYLSHEPEPVTRDAISRRAYSLWEDEGRPVNRGLANWLAAETQLQPNSPVRIRAIPSVRLDPLPGERGPSAPAEARAPARRKVAHDGPSPLCREAAGDDLRDYAFHLFVLSGCDLARRDDCWREAKLCLDARIPEALWEEQGTDRGRE